MSKWPRMTPEEIAQAAEILNSEAHGVWKAWNERQDARSAHVEAHFLRKKVDDLQAKLDKVRALHTKHETFARCATCDPFGDHGIDWPCPTIEAVGE